MLARIALAIVAATVWIGCSKGPPAFEEVPPAEELFAEGQKELEGKRLLNILPWVNYDSAIEKFQAIIDNYPYSEYAVLAELAIADAYFADHRYEEALSYYRDFIDLHPQHEKVPYTIFQAAMCHERRVKSPIDLIWRASRVRRSRQISSAASAYSE